MPLITIEISLLETISRNERVLKENGKAEWDAMTMMLFSSFMNSCYTTTTTTLAIIELYRQKNGCQLINYLFFQPSKFGFELRFSFPSRHSLSYQQS